MAIKIEISSIEDLKEFVRILRCRDLDKEELALLTSKLTKSSETLKVAMEESEAVNKRVKSGV